MKIKVCKSIEQIMFLATPAQIEGQIGDRNVCVEVSMDRNFDFYQVAGYRGKLYVCQTVFDVLIPSKILGVFDGLENQKFLWRATTVYDDRCMTDVEI